VKTSLFCNSTPIPANDVLGKEARGAMSQSRDLGCVPILVVGWISLLVFYFIAGPEQRPPEPPELTQQREREAQERKLDAEQRQLDAQRRKEVTKATRDEWRAAVGKAGELCNAFTEDRSVWLWLDYSAWSEMDDVDIRAANREPGGVAGLQRLVDAGKVKAYPVGTRVRMTEPAGPNSWKIMVLDGTGGEGWVRDSQIGAPSPVPVVYVALKWLARACVIALVWAMCLGLIGLLSVMVRAIKRHVRSVKPKPDRWEL
jgi:hypothetical protein